MTSEPVIGWLRRPAPAVAAALERLQRVLRQLDHPAIAVSGGVDSMTLAVVAHRLHPGCRVFHAVSPAVPAAATARVREYAAREKWHLTLIDAGEMRDPAYLSNPLNRCYHCKSALYRTIAARAGGQIVSGTNLDDLADFRPGLQAAAEAGVRHPLVEAEIDKRTIRAVAAGLGLDVLAGLPASPCLSSRVTTGTPIDAALLPLLDRVESRLRDITGAGPLDNVRCRLRPDSVTVELEPVLLERGLSSELIGREVRLVFGNRFPAGTGGVVRVGPYVQGSAFVGKGEGVWGTGEGA